EIGDPRFEARISQARVDFPVEFVDDLRRRILGSTNSLPTNTVKVGYELCYRRQLGQYVRAFERGHRKRAQLACPNMLDRCRKRIEHELHLTGKKIGKRRTSAPVWHVQHVDLGH